MDAFSVAAGIASFLEQDIALVVHPVLRARLALLRSRLFSRLHRDGLVLVEYQLTTTFGFPPSIQMVWKWKKDDHPDDDDGGGVVRL